MGEIKGGGQGAGYLAKGSRRFALDLDPRIKVKVKVKVNAKDKVNVNMNVNVKVKHEGDRVEVKADMNVQGR